MSGQVHAHRAPTRARGSAANTHGVITDGSANVLSSNLYDNFGTEMYASGSAATQWRFVGRFVEEEGLVAAAGGGGDTLVARGARLCRAVARPQEACTTLGRHNCGAERAKKWCRACCARARGVHLCCCAWLPGTGLTIWAVCNDSHFCAQLPTGTRPA